MRFADFTNIPFEGKYGCILLVAKVYMEMYGIQLPVNGDAYDIHDELVQHAVQVEDPKPGDVILLRTDPWHCGVVTQRGFMLHTYRQQNSCIERYTTLRWKDKISGFYRHKIFTQVRLN